MNTRRVIYLRVDKGLKEWLDAVSKREKLSRNLLVARILKTAKKNPKFINAAK